MFEWFITFWWTITTTSNVIVFLMTSEDGKMESAIVGMMVVILFGYLAMKNRIERFGRE
jgi:hypothetical protein